MCGTLQVTLRERNTLFCCDQLPYTYMLYSMGGTQMACCSLLLRCCSSSLKWSCFSLTSDCSLTTSSWRPLISSWMSVPVDVDIRLEAGWATAMGLCRFCCLSFFSKMNWMSVNCCGWGCVRRYWSVLLRAIDARWMESSRSIEARMLSSSSSDTSVACNHIQRYTIQSWYTSKRDTLIYQPYVSRSDVSVIPGGPKPFFCNMHNYCACRFVTY